MNCRQVVSMISAYIDGELTGVDMLDMRSHVLKCSDCERELNDMRNIKHSLACLRTMVPADGLVDSILCKLDVTSIPYYRRMFDKIRMNTSAKLSPVSVALAACGVALVLLSSGGSWVDNITNSKDETLMASNIAGFKAENTILNPIMSKNYFHFTDQKPLRLAASDSNWNMSKPTFAYASYISE